jgi:hypothetical protein
LYTPLFVFVKNTEGVAPSFAGGEGFPLSGVIIRVVALGVGPMGIEKRIGNAVEVASYNRVGRDVGGDLV